MNEQEIALKINDHEHEIKSLKHRVDEVEERQSEISSLTQSVNELVINMRYMMEEQKAQGERLRKIEAEPLDDAKHYKRLAIGCIITTVIGGIIGALLTLIFA